MQEFDRPKIKLAGTVEGIIFRNETNGYTVCEMKGVEDEFIAVGLLPYIQEGEHLELVGSFVLHPDYGPQFQVDEYARKSFTTEEAIERYLASGILKGIGPKIAKKIVSRFGLQSLEIIKNEPWRMTDIKGIHREKALEYAATLAKKESFEELALFLAPFDIGQSTCILIEKQFGAEALSRIRTNPYCLLQTGLGIRFQKADQIAISMGWDIASLIRIQSALIACLFSALANGHTYVPIDSLLAEASKLAMFPIAEENPSFDAWMGDERIVYLEKSRIVALKLAYQTEKAISASLLQRLASRNKTVPMDALRIKVNELCRRQPIPFDSDQIESLCRCLANPVSIITGGPGTGKTTLISILCRYIHEQAKTAALAAPTGRAAKKMQEATGTDAKTIHRLLELQYRSDIDDFHLVFARNEENPIEADLVIIDETSMLDIFLMNHLLRAVPTDCPLVFVGDENQLPAVGAGNVLKDMIASKKVPVVELKKVYRQGTGSLIVRNSHSILHGVYPVFDQTLESEFMLISKGGEQEKAMSAVSLCTNVLKSQYGLDPVRDVQILTPTRKGLCGTRELNRVFQAALNPASGNPSEKIQIPLESPDRSDRSKKRSNPTGIFAVRDKVMQVKNNYEAKWTSLHNPSATGNGVFNGDMGTVVSTDPDSETVCVLFDENRLVEYNPTNIEEIELAYAITVHKSQGSEYKTVVLVLPDAPDILMTRNLLYTAVSRAKEKLFLITEKRILQKMIDNNTIAKRNTLLERFLGE